MSPERTPDTFDSWAAGYDAALEWESDSFPFLGYNEVLTRILELADPKPGMKILDVGIGTGNLAQKFVEFDCEIWGLDFAPKMLEIAKEKIPDANLILADIRDDWYSIMQTKFDRIVSAYTMHHLKLDGKLNAVKQMTSRILNEGGRIIIGDISFRSFAERSEARKQMADLWDDSEFYWAADEFKTMFWGQGFYVAYEQISSCAGVYIIIDPHY